MNSGLGSRVVFVFGSGIDSLAATSLSGEATQLDRILESIEQPVEFYLISIGLAEGPSKFAKHLKLDGIGSGPIDNFLRAIGAIKLRERLSTFPIGKLLNSLGPVDLGRVFWRVVKRSSEALEMLKTADVVVATDQPAIKTAWIAGNRKWTTHAIYDHAALSSIQDDAH